MPRSSHEQHSEWAACWLIGSWRTARSAGGRLRGADLELEFAAHLRQLIDQVLPLAYAQPAEILALADTAQRIVARLAIGLEDTSRCSARSIVAGRIRIPVVERSASSRPRPGVHADPEGSGTPPITSTAANVSACLISRPRSPCGRDGHRWGCGRAAVRHASASPRRACGRSP